MVPTNPKPTTFIATWGVWPQVVTFALDRLLPADIPFRLICIPMMPWGSYFPALRELLRPSVLDDVLARKRRMMGAARTRCQADDGRLDYRCEGCIIHYSELIRMDRLKR